MGMMLAMEYRGSSGGPGVEGKTSLGDVLRRSDAHLLRGGTRSVLGLVGVPCYIVQSVGAGSGDSSRPRFLRTNGRSRTMGILIEKLRDRTGAAIVLVAVTMVALLSAVALAIDVGMLMTAKAEADLLADATALEGARVLRDTNGDSAQAHDEAVAFGSTNNTVRGEHVTILNEDVDVITDEWTVRVRVYNTQDRGSALKTFFARIFGVDEVNVTTHAAAWAAPSQGVNTNTDSHCLLPLALVDEWVDLNGNGVYDQGEPYDPDNGIGGYDENDHGKLIKLKIHSNDEETGPPECRTDATDDRVSNDIDYCQDGGESASWRCWWREAEPDEGGGGGVDVLGPRIYPGDECIEDMSIGDTVWAASGSGNKQSLVTNDEDDHHFEALVRSDIDLEWCPTCGDGHGCVVHVDDPETCYDGTSGRIRASPVVDPRIDGGGSGTYSVINNFIGVFVEQVSCSYAAGPFQTEADGRWNVYVRLLVTGGQGSIGEGGESEKSLVRTLQLIE